jgi:hypothetical protein
LAASVWAEVAGSAVAKCERGDSNPHPFRGLDPKSSASANSATLARGSGGAPPPRPSALFGLGILPRMGRRGHGPRWRSARHQPLPVRHVAATPAALRDVAGPGLLGWAGRLAAAGVGGRHAWLLGQLVPTTGGAQGCLVATHQPLELLAAAPADVFVNRHGRCLLALCQGRLNGRAAVGWRPPAKAHARHARRDGRLPTRGPAVRYTKL